MNDDLEQRARDLAAQPYSVTAFRDDSDPNEPLYAAFHPELEGCVAQGETPEEARAILEELRVIYIEHLLEHNLPVPMPQELVMVTRNVTEDRSPTAILKPSR